MASPVPPAGDAFHGKRAVIVANKTWEADPLVGLLRTVSLDPSQLPRPKDVAFVPADATTPGLCGTVGDADCRVEIWCLQELMDPKLSSSSTKEKARVLPILLDGENIRIVVAFGTAATPGPESANGCVAIGTQAFIHDAQPGGKTSWNPPQPDTLLTSSLSSDDFRALVGDPGYRLQVESRFVAPPLSPAAHRVLLSAYNYVALADVNVPSYDDYAWADVQTVRAFEQAVSHSPIGSLETTHAVIRTFAKAPFLFVSGITDRIGNFNADLAPRTYAQNFSAAHNAGVATAFLIPQLLAALAH